MLGRDEEYCSALERAYQAHLERGGGLPAARCAFWLGLNLMLRGETGRATGWMGRAQRLVEREESECVEQGYLMLPAMFRHEAAGELEAAAATAGAAGAIGERFGDADLFALCAQARGTYLVMLGPPRGRARAAGRGHGGGHRGRAVADRQRPRLLRRDPRLPGRVRAPPRPRVDRPP